MKISEITYEWAWFWNQLGVADYYCEKACGCGHCDLKLLEQFAFSDRAVYHVGTSTPHPYN